MGAYHQLVDSEYPMQILCVILHSAKLERHCSILTQLFILANSEIRPSGLRVLYSSDKSTKQALLCIHLVHHLEGHVEHCRRLVSEAFPISQQTRISQAVQCMLRTLDRTVSV